MTDVLVRLTAPSSGAAASGWVPADEVAAVGHLECRPYAPGVDGARLHLEAPDRLLLPASFTVRLVGGEALLHLAPTGAGWCWQIIERMPRGKARYVLVPDSVATLDYGDLVDVDPTTLDPTAVPEAAWWAAIEGIGGDIGQAVADYLAANPPSVGGLDSLTDVDTAGQVDGDVLLRVGGVWVPETPPVGPAGPQGPAGATGPAGPQGEVGPTGPAGPTGPTGAQGPQGETGATGPAGPTAVSADPGNLAALGMDGLLHVPAAHTHAASEISDSTTTGRTLITAATATAARTAISAAPALGSDDNYVTDDEKLALHSHANKTALDLVSGTNTGDQDLSGLVPTSRTVAGKALSSNITIGAADLSATGTKDSTTVLHGDNTWKVPAGGGSDPWTYYVVSTETTNNTTTHVNAAGLSIPSGLTAGTYLIDAFVVSKLSANGGHNYQLTKPTGGQLNTLASGARGPSEVWQYADTHAGGNLTVSPSSHPNNTWGAPGAEFKATLYVASGATSTAMNITFAPTTAGTLMTIMRGSYIAIRRIA